MSSQDTLKRKEPPAQEAVPGGEGGDNAAKRHTAPPSPAQQQLTDQELRALTYEEVVAKLAVQPPARIGPSCFLRAVNLLAAQEKLKVFCDGDLLCQLERELPDYGSDEEGQEEQEDEEDEEDDEDEPFEGKHRAAPQRDAQLRLEALRTLYPNARDERLHTALGFGDVWLVGRDAPASQDQSNAVLCAKLAAFVISNDRTLTLGKELTAYQRSVLRLYASELEHDLSVVSVGKGGARHAVVLKKRDEVPSEYICPIR